MSIEADDMFLSGSGGSKPVLSERERAFVKARRHSRAVRILRFALPVCAFATLGLYFLSSDFRISVGGMKASVARVEVSKDRLRMIEPKLEGVSDDQGAYTLTADYAEQEISNSNIVHLHKIRADIDNPKEGWTRMTAPKGRFDTASEKLLLLGNIRVANSGGMTSRLTRAEIDMKTQRTYSSEPVTVEALNGTINSDTMEIWNSERVVIFRGNIKVHIHKRPVKTTEGAVAQ